MGTAGRLLVIALAPSAVAGVAVWLPRGLQVLRALLRGRRASPPPGPPLEVVAADLRRLLDEHETVRRSVGLPARTARLAALEGALTDRALDAARAVGLDPPARSGREPLPRPGLRRLLTDLRAEGLVLPSADRFGR